MHFLDLLFRTFVQVSTFISKWPVFKELLMLDRHSISFDTSKYLKNKVTDRTHEFYPMWNNWVLSGVLKFKQIVAFLENCERVDKIVLICKFFGTFHEIFSVLRQLCTSDTAQPRRLDQSSSKFYPFLVIGRVNFFRLDQIMRFHRAASWISFGLRTFITFMCITESKIRLFSHLAVFCNQKFQKIMCEDTSDYGKVINRNHFFWPINIV